MLLLKIHLHGVLVRVAMKATGITGISNGHILETRPNIGLFTFRGPHLLSWRILPGTSRASAPG